MRNTNFDHLFDCDDCHEGPLADGEVHGVITARGNDRQYCEPCYRWRSMRGWTFDPRTKFELQRGRDERRTA